MTNDYMTTISETEELPILETRDFSPDYSPPPPVATQQIPSNPD